jgi:hypothetical protein
MAYVINVPGMTIAKRSRGDADPCCFLSGTAPGNDLVRRGILVKPNRQIHKSGNDGRSYFGFWKKR